MTDKNEHLLLVGGTTGTGRTLAERMAADGVIVSIIGRTAEPPLCLGPEPGVRSRRH